MSNDQGNHSTVRRAPSIAIAFRTLGRTLRHGYENLGTLVLCSIFWYVGALLVLPIGVVTAALHRVVQPMTEARAASSRTFWEHLRTDLRWSSGLAALLLAVFLLVPLNIRFYLLSSAAPLRFVALFFVMVLIVWLGVMLYAFPLALRQQDQHVWRTLRNALVMTMANLPGASVSVLLLLLLCGMLFFIPPLFVFIPGVVALWSEENARLLLVASGYVAEDPIADRPRRPK